MDIFLLLGTAILPVALLIYFIYKKDKYQPEPASQLIIAFCLGLFSTIFSFCFSLPMQGLLGAADIENNPTFFNLFQSSFLEAAFPEELAKFILLFLLLRTNKYFDEWFDGIVYASMIGLGFACLENILYLVENYDAWVQVGIMRGIFSVPGHFFFAVIMGYFYSLYRFSQPEEKKKWLFWAIVAPMIAHGIFDFILMWSDASELIGGLLMVVFVIAFIWLRKYCCKLIAKHLQSDSTRFTPPPYMATPPPFLTTPPEYKE